MRLRYRLRSLLIVVLLAAIYLSGYCALLKPDVFIVESSGGVGHGYREPSFRVGATALRFAYLPLISLDQQILRPDYWDDYSTLDHVRCTQDYSWGHIEIVDGYETSMSLYPHSNKDVDAAIGALHDLDRITLVRVNGEHFGDSHLRTLQGIREFDSVELLATSVTRAAVDDFRSSHPTTDVTCIAVTENGAVVY